MGVVIGKDVFGFASTWGSLRGAFYNSTFDYDNPNNPFPPNWFLGYPYDRHNRIYINDGDGVNFPPTWFTDESGSLFRTPPGDNPGLWWIANTSFPFNWDGTLSFGSALPPFPMANEEYDQFVGKVLQSPVDSVILGTDANVTPQPIDLFFANFYPGFTTIEGMTVIP
jgi:hypothetical protein